MIEEDINNLKEMLVDFNEYSTDYTKTRCRELEETIKNTLEEIERLNKENKELKSDLEYVMEQAYGAFTQNWCIDWNFTNIREKYNISNELGSDKE